VPKAGAACDLYSPANTSPAISAAASSCIAGITWLWMSSVMAMLARPRSASAPEPLLANGRLLISYGEAGDQAKTKKGAQA
jgi:hypothetical protein